MATAPSVVAAQARLCQRLFAASRTLYFEHHLASKACHYLHRYIGFMTETPPPSSPPFTLLGAGGDDEADGVVVLSAILFLVGKVSEEVRRPRDVLNSVRFTFGHTPETLTMGEGYHQLKEQIIQREHTLLRILGFDTHVDLPHQYLLNIANFLRLKQDAVRVAWRLLNDGYLRRESSCERPVVAASACLLLGTALTTPQPRPALCDQARLFEPFEVRADELAKAAEWISETQALFATNAAGDVVGLRGPDDPEPVPEHPEPMNNNLLPDPAAPPVYKAIKKRKAEGDVESNSD